MAPVSWALDKYYYVGDTPGWTHFPHRDNLFFVVDAEDGGKTMLKVVYEFDTKVSIDITGASSRRPELINSATSSKLLVVARSPVLAVRFLQNNQETNRFQIRFRLAQDFETVISWFESHGYSIKHSSEPSKSQKIQPKDAPSRLETSYQSEFFNPTQINSQMQPPSMYSGSVQPSQRDERNVAYLRQPFVSPYNNSVPNDQGVFEWASHGMTGPPEPSGFHQSVRAMTFNEPLHLSPASRRHTQTLSPHIGFYSNSAGIHGTLATPYPPSRGVPMTSNLMYNVPGHPTHYQTAGSSQIPDTPMVSLPRSSGIDMSQRQVSVPTPPESQYQRAIHTSGSSSSYTPPLFVDSPSLERDIIISHDDLPPPRPPPGYGMTKQPKAPPIAAPISTPVNLETVAEIQPKVTNKKRKAPSEFPPLKMPTPIAKGAKIQYKNGGIEIIKSKSPPDEVSVDARGNTLLVERSDSSTSKSRKKDTRPHSSKRKKIGSNPGTKPEEQITNETEEARHEREAKELEQRVIDTLYDDDFIKLCENLSRVWHRLGFANAGRDIIGRINDYNEGQTN